MAFVYYLIIFSVGLRIGVVFSYYNFLGLITLLDFLSFFGFLVSSSLMLTDSSLIENSEKLSLIIAAFLLTFGFSFGVSSF